MVDPHGSYPRVPLEKDNITLAVVQSAAPARVSERISAHEAKSQNLAHVCDLVRSSLDSKPDIVLLHEFPLTGYLTGPRDHKELMCIDVPGPETRALGKLARELDAYLIFGAWVRDPDFCGHVFNKTTVLGRDGEVLKAVWKPRNIKRFLELPESYGSTIESLHRRFLERHSPDDIFPVIKTEFGNIAVTSVQLDPMAMAAFGMKGAEMILRSSTLFYPADVIATALTSNVYSAMASMPIDHDEYGGGSMMVDPMGNVVGRLGVGLEEGVLTCAIPIAGFREGRRLPHVSLGLTGHVFEQYTEEIPLDHMDLHPSRMPRDEREMKSLLDEQSRWLIKDSD